MKNQRGSTILEFAVVLPLLLLLVIGMFRFSILGYQYLTLNEATVAGAQEVSINRGTGLDPCALAVSAIKAAAVNLNPASLSVSISFNGGSAVTTGTCSPQALVAGQTINVAATYPCSVAIPGCILKSQVAETIQ